jgi:hypothetical protein
MIYFLATILFLAIWALCDVISNEIKSVEIQKKRKFNIPPEFWQDYDRTIFQIERMQINEVNRVQYMVDDIIIKYHECLDYNTFTERISILVERFELRKKDFLSNTHLN